MARIRSIKPEIAQDAKLARVARETRYHFVLLWTAADDEGFFRANPRSMLGQLYPHDQGVTEQDVERMNASLASGGFIDICNTPDGPLGMVRNWKKHQRIDRPSKSHLGEIFAQHSRNPREGAAHGVLSPDLGVLSPDQDAAADLCDADELGVSVPPDPELTALFLTVCANRAVAERWGESTHPYTVGSAVSLYEVLRADGVPPEIARLSFYRQCRSAKQASPPRAINYFRAGIQEDWQEEQARAALASSGETPPPDEPVRRPSRGGTVAERTYRNGVVALMDP